MKTKQIILSILLIIILSTAFYIEQFIAWETFNFGPVFIVIILFGILKMIFYTMDITQQRMGYIFAISTCLYFIIYTYMTFSGYRGGTSALSIAVPILLIMTYAYASLYSSKNNKTTRIILDGFLIITHVMLILFIMGGIGLASYGVL